MKPATRLVAAFVVDGRRTPYVRLCDGRFDLQLTRSGSVEGVIIAKRIRRRADIVVRFSPAMIVNRGEGISYPWPPVWSDA